MIKFLAKGLIRDRSRSLFPLLTIIITVTLVIFGIGFMEGAMNNFLQSTAVISSGHVKVVTKAYEKESCLLYTSPSPRDRYISRMPSSA